MHSTPKKALFITGLVAASSSWGDTEKASKALSSAPKDKVEEVLIIGRRESDYSVITERAQKIIDVPGALGDPLMAAMSLPGVISQGEFGPPAIRGSSPSDNLYMVDGAPAGYVFHAFSTSIFNENIIQDFELYSAGFGAQYSNAIGGVFDITLRQPKHEPISTKLDVGVLRSGIFVEGAATESSAFYVSARSSMLQYFINDSAKKDIEESDGIRVEKVPQDNDYQLKYVYELNANNQFTLSANGANDLAQADFTNSSTIAQQSPDFAGDAKIDNGYNNAMLSWHHKGDADRLLKFTLGHFTKKNDLNWGGEKYFLDLDHSDDYFIAQAEQPLNSAHTFSTGFEFHHINYFLHSKLINYVCTETDADCLYRRGNLVEINDQLDFNEGTVFINDHWMVNPSFALDLGVQSHYYSQADEQITNPRAAATWILNDRWTLSTLAGAYDRRPEMDKVFPALGNPDLKSPTSNHYTLGVKHTLTDGWSWSATAYYKTMDKLPLAMGINEAPNYTNNTEGEAYGLDIFVNKELTERWYGWLALSTSKSLRTNKLTQVQKNYYLDTPVVLNWVGSYKFTEKLTGGLRFTAQTGRAYTPIIGVQKNPYFDNAILPVYGDPFSENLPTYARLDIRFKMEDRIFGYAGSYYVDILNVTNRQNVTDRDLDYKKTALPNKFQIEDQVGLGIIPAIGMSVTL